MKKLLLIGTLVLLFGSSDVMAQGWLKKLGDKAMKAKETINKVGNSPLISSGEERENPLLEKANNGLNTINNKMGYAQSEFFSPMPAPEIEEVGDMKPKKLDLPEQFTPGASLPDGLTRYRILNDLLANMPSKDSIAAYWADTTGYYVKGAQCVAKFREELIKLGSDMKKNLDDSMEKIKDMGAEQGANAMLNALTGGMQAQLNSAMSQANAAFQQLEENQDLIEAGFQNMAKLGEYYGVDPMTPEGAKTIDEKFNSLSEPEQMAICEKIGIKTVKPKNVNIKEQYTTENVTGLTDDEMQVLQTPMDFSDILGVDSYLSAGASDLYTNELQSRKQEEEFKALYGELFYNVNKTIEDQYKETSDHWEFIGNINTVHEQKRKANQARYDYFKNVLVPDKYAQILKQWEETNANISKDVLETRRKIVSVKMAASVSKQDKSKEIELWSQMETDKGLILIDLILDFIDGVPTELINGFWMSKDFLSNDSYKRIEMDGGVG